ncbi:MAG TPA: FecR domain-containing protein [Candidatus Dormibacteraeota bacterium]|nr:FecR domain-containing protein [Candidatus Dormibacteraeota bacterium]
MNNDYLWDGSGKPDPDIENLERVLGRFRHNRPAPRFPEIIPGNEPRRSRFAWSLSIFQSLVVATGAMAVLFLSVWFVHRSIRGAAGEETFAVTGLQGAPKVGTQAFTTRGQLSIGQSLSTDQNSRARIHVNDFGDVTIEPNSRVRLLDARSNRKQLALDRGGLHARITAPPWQFYVETPSATAVDLGCEYTLTVDDSGAGLLRVTFGWVQFYSGDRQALIPAGAAARTRPGIGPGTPYFEDVSPGYQKALEELDFGKGAPAARAAALDLLLKESRSADVLSLFPLLSRVSESERGLIYERLSVLSPAPLGVTREGIIRGDNAQISLWWDHWGLGHPKK